MKILAIDTSSKNAAVAILENQNTIIELNNDDEKTHSQKLMPMIDEAFKKSNLSLDDINLISCCLGPGSFTGVRIGIATAKAFADSDNQFQISIVSLCNWLKIGTTQMHTSYLKELQTFEYISRVQDADEKTIFSWDNVVKSKSGTYKLMVKFVNAGKYELHNNDIEDLYHQCFD